MTTPAAWRVKLAPFLLGAALLQVLMFFFGLTVPLNRIFMLAGKTPEERLAAIEPRGAVISRIANQLPLDAKVYLEDPEAVTHKFSVYYFYPREVVISMTNANYEGIYDQWNERPSMEWLQAHHFTHVLSYKERKLTPVPPAGLPVEPAR